MRSAFTGMLLLSLFLSPSSLSAQDRTASLKAAYLYYFTKFVYWPETAKIRRICIYGKDVELEQELRKVEDKSDGSIQLTYLEENSDDARSELCDIAFLRNDQWRDLDVNHGTLLVVDETVVHPDAAIKLILRNNKLAFDINRKNAKKKDLEVSAKLLGLAREVID